jgi:hypothetical protein
MIWPGIAAADMPNRRLTPGAVADWNAAVVCAYDYTKTHRHVPYPVRDAVYREYGIPRGTRASSPRRGYVIDHLFRSRRAAAMRCAICGRNTAATRS